MKFEPNHKRKSHRITIPIDAIIEHHTYKVLDWSAAGLRVTYIPENLQKGDTMILSLLLPTEDAAIILKVTAIVRNIYTDSCGMEITEISDRNRRVLRHYATLAIEGNFNQIENLSSNLFMTDVQTPIKEPVLLTDKEDQDLHQQFLKKLFYVFLFAILFFVLVFFTFLHNYIVIASENGVVTGNTQRYQAPYDGKIKKIYVAPNQRVAKAQLLFEMDTKNDRERLNYHRKRQKRLEKRVRENREMLEKLYKSLKVKNSDIQHIAEKKKAYLQSRYALEKASMKKAKYLYEKHFITYVKYKEIENTYTMFLKEYTLSQQNTGTDREKLMAQQEALKIKDQILSMQKIVQTIEESLQKNRLAILELQQKIDHAMVLSSQRGVVHTLRYNSNEVVKFTEDVIVMEVHKKPYILTKISLEKVASLHRGEACLIYYSKPNATFSGKIVAFGNEDSADIVGSTKDEVIVKIVPEREGVDLKFNEYVKVYFLNDSKTAQKVISFLPRALILK